jgi:hypothetical protein
MVSVASHVGRTLHRHEREMSAQEDEMAAEEQRERARADQQWSDRDSEDRKRASHYPSADEVYAKDEARRDTRIAAISKLRDRHDTRRKTLRDKHRAELDKARKVAPTSAAHEPQRVPMEHQGRAFVIWKDLNAARASAMQSVFASTAALRDRADADVLDLTKSTSGNRYMQAGARMAGEAQSRAERAHLDISRKEQQQLDELASRFEREIDGERRRIHQHAVERASLEQRQMEESRRGMR